MTDLTQIIESLENEFIRRDEQSSFHDTYHYIFGAIGVLRRARRKTFEQIRRMDPHYLRRTGPLQGRGNSSGWASPSNSLTYHILKEIV